MVAAENWWKLRNRFEERKEGHGGGEGYQSESGWLHNVIVSKHADAMEAYPEPLILPREPGDEEEARLLSAILPCILEQNRFEKTYDAAMWQKLKTGTAAYRVVWDGDKLGGLGDIRIERVDLLNLFWEPGVDDIQESRYLFCTHLEDEDLLCEQYPQLRGPPALQPLPGHPLRLRRRGEHRGQGHRHRGLLQAPGRAALLQVRGRHGAVRHGERALGADREKDSAATKEPRSRGAGKRSEKARNRRTPVPNFARTPSPERRLLTPPGSTPTGAIPSCWTRSSPWRAAPAATASWISAPTPRPPST